MPAAGAGYSGTPLARKLGIRPEHAVVLVRRPDAWRLPDLPPAVTVSAADAAGAAPPGADVVVAFFRSPAELESDLPALRDGLDPAAALWIAWPRRAGGHTSDITENLRRELLLPTGLVDVKVAAMDQDRSGLKFVWRKENRPPRRRPRRPLIAAPRPAADRADPDRRGAGPGTQERGGPPPAVRRSPPGGVPAGVA